MALLDRSHSCSHLEAASLIHFKNSFSITQTDHAALYCDDFASLKSYPKTNSWKEGTDCCSWDGVTCDHLNAHVIALDLSCSWLYGTFPSNTTLFLLPHLQKLNLAYNDFNSSKIPSEFGRFTSLFYLNLSNTWFSEVPSQVSHLSKLVSLDLSGFDELLTIDKYALEGLVHNLTQVRRLFLDEMDMSSVNAHVFMNLSSSLRSLSLSGNQNLNLDLLKFSRSSNLEHLGLSWISFSTELIDSVGNLQALKYLDLSGNSFFQRFSVSITNLSSLEYLIISEANMCGGLPDSMGNLESLKFLDLSSNELSGQIPLSILNLTQLEYLEIARNSLEGSIPDENIAFLDLSSNLICGNLPIPASTIRVFLISNNSFNGEVSSLISNASSLRILDLSHNNLSGTILQCFGDLSNYLEFLNLNKNKFYGTIPPTFAKGCQLSNFQLKWKYVRRAFDTILNCKGLEVLDLGNNKINDTFPHWGNPFPTCGMAMGCAVFQTGKAKRLVNLAEDQHEKRRRRKPKYSNRING
ncbi:hypothetical protein ES332_D05G441500v1 [Gossypium tomentosum]|uniref:Uncharacterized protein n=1 Tax=Gossypium tomentosum TaxID=34277 RepID=A0A5D2L777_GOSTO|nr:hypothetical protein ES332_D05G441500v1 [Gossypium tomentosum]